MAMSVQGFTEPPSPMGMSDESKISLKSKEKTKSQEQDSTIFPSSHQRSDCTEIDPVPVAPERTSASNLDQFKAHMQSNKSAPSRRITSPSSGMGPNPWTARKISYQSERIVPNDDLALSKARASGARNFSPRVSISFLKFLLTPFLY